MIDFIIIQAGGKGTRMQHLTANKPKALVPINNLPMIFHLFKKYPNKKFVIIGDYKCDVLKRYLQAFADVDYAVVDAYGKKGTCGGLQDAFKLIPCNEPFMLIWSDLILNQDQEIPELIETNYVGISKNFECRWKYETGKFSEEKSSTCGVAGMFIFKEKSMLANVPVEGEFVKWLSLSNITFDIISLDKTKEYGLLSEYNKLSVTKCRPFNKITIYDNYIIKEGIDEQGKQLAVREVAWYEKAKEYGNQNLPIIYSTQPLKLEFINGRNIYEYSQLDLEKKKKILFQLVDCLKQLHTYEMVPFDKSSYDDAYIGKTFARLNKVKELVPFADNPVITINGKECKNVFYHEKELKSLLEKYEPNEFVFIHGDCTFSNIMLRNDTQPVLIDPRGYFGKTEFFGDAAYDWAKLYYSLVGNYDQFNLKRFVLDIKKHDVSLSIASSGWEQLESYFFELLSDDVSKEQLKLIHAIIWLSLTTYAWQDYDSVCGAFYNGIYYLNDLI